MKKYFLANWKENKVYDEAIPSLESLVDLLKTVDFDRKEVVVFPPVVYLLDFFRRLRSGSRILLGVQDISRFVEGEYTGEVSAAMVSPFAKYCLVGHSERRRKLGESEAVVNLKIDVCLRFNLTPIICVGSEAELGCIELPGPVSRLLIAFEPPEAIGRGDPADRDQVLSFARLVKRRFSGAATFLYGGSVSAENIVGLLRGEEVGGVLVGTKSLEPKEFSKIVLA